MDKREVGLLWRKVLILAESILITMALFADLSATGVREILGMDGVQGLFAAVGIFLILMMLPKAMPKGGRATWASVVPAALFSLMMLIGKSFYVAKSFAPISSSLMRIGCAVVIFVGCFLLFERMMALLIERVSAAPGHETQLFRRIFPDDAGALRTAAILLVFWLPYLVFMFPGGHSGDMHDQIAQFLGYDCRTARISAVIDPNVYINSMHPVAHTVLMGFFIKLFMRGGDITTGFFLFNLTQVLVTSLILGRTVSVMRKFGLSRTFRMGAIAFYGLNPMIPLYAYSTAKDTVFSILLVVVVTLLAEAFLAPDQKLKSPRWIASYIGAALAFLLFRNSAIFIAMVLVPTGYFAIAGIRRVRGVGWKAALAGALIAPILLGSLVTNVVYPAFAIRKGTERETMSLLFQQTAYYAITHADEVTEKEADVIRKVLAYDEFAERYVPWRADAIKMTFNDQATPAEVKAYYGVWFAQFLKHPITYLEAGINMCFAYYYPAFDPTQYKPFYYRPRSATFVFDGDTYRIVQGRFFNLTTKLGKAFVVATCEAPLTGIIYQLGAYAWLLIAMAFLCLKSRARVGLLLIPFLALLLGLGFTAVNGSMRYMLGIIYAVPLIVAIGVAGARGVKYADVAIKD